MNKKAKYTINGALIGGGIGFAINAIDQIIEIINGNQKKFNWDSALKTGGIGALLGGTSGFVVGAVTDYHNTKEKPLDTDSILKNYAKDIKLKKDNPEFLYTDRLAKRLEGLMWNEFFEELVGQPERLGSTVHGVALNSHFDIDVALQFHPGSFSSTENMNTEVSNHLSYLKERGRISDFRMQKKSIGVFMKSGNNKLVKIDIVPYKRTNDERDYGYLSVKKETIFGGVEYSFQKTDITALNSLYLTKTQKDIIVILKKWKLEGKIPLSSNLLQSLVLDAYYFNKGCIPRSFTKKVIMVLRHISENLEELKLVGIENTNNVITDISAYKKDSIVRACKKLIDEYEYQSNSIIDSLIV